MKITTFIFAVLTLACFSLPMAQAGSSAADGAEL